MQSIQDVINHMLENGIETLLHWIMAFICDSSPFTVQIKLGLDFKVQLRQLVQIFHSRLWKTHVAFLLQVVMSWDIEEESRREVAKRF
uniref:Uncharacterized protein n=2 Tax=Triticum TaxID=4564 RepID=A0A8R7U874_TRIUA